jgi:hypothetical protein
MTFVCSYYVAAQYIPQKNGLQVVTFMLEVRVNRHQETKMSKLRVFIHKTMFII